MSNSPAKSFTVSSSYSGKPIAVDAHSYSSSVFTTGISSSTLSQKNSPKSTSQPCKKFKQDDDNDVTVVTSANETWLQAGSHKLTLYDQMILINKTELSDRHINFSQYLLHNQFPAIKGFGLTLLQEKPLTAKLPNGSVQIIHNSRRYHWLVASTINCYRGEVKIYDSVYTIPDAEVRRIVKNIFHTARNPSFVMIKMQKQKGHVDCGVFAIAIATSLAYGIDPAS